MLRLLSFAGRLRRLPYALSSSAAFFSQHLLVLLILALAGHPVAAITSDWPFYVVPLQTLLRRHGATSDPILWLALGCVLLAAWTLAALAFRRAADAGVSEWVAPLALAPALQIPVMLGL